MAAEHPLNALQREILRVLGILKKAGRTAQSWSKDAGLGETFVKDILKRSNPSATASRLARLALAAGLDRSHFTDIVEASKVGDPDDQTQPHLVPSPISHGSEPDTLVTFVDRIESLIHNADALPRDIPVIGTNPRWPGVGDIGMGRQIAGRIRRPTALRNRPDVRAIYTKQGRLMILERGVRPPRRGDEVVVVLNGDGDWRPAYIRHFVDETPTKIIVSNPGTSGTTEIDLKKVDEVYRVLTMDDLFG